MTNVLKENRSLPEHAKTVVEPIPDELKCQDIWICWTASKQPINPVSGGNASKTDPGTWTDLDTAVAALQDGMRGVFEKNGDTISEMVCGLGIAVTGNYVLLDIDGAIDDGGYIRENIENVLKQFNSWTEISQSGNGLHVIIKHEQGIPKVINVSPDWVGCEKIEVYQDHFAFLTGEMHESSPSRIRSANGTLNALYNELSDDQEQLDQNLNHRDQATLHPQKEPKNDLEDRDVLELLKEESDTWRDVVENGYLSEKSQSQPDVSSFDMSLINKLWFYSGHDRDQTARLFRGILSKENRPRNPEKLDRDSYIEPSINEAAETIKEAYTGKHPDNPAGQEIINQLCGLLRNGAIAWPNNRTRRTRRAVYIGLLKIAKRTNKTSFSASVRELSELSGTSRQTVSDATCDLVEYGLIGHSGKNKRGTKTYSLVPREEIPDKLRQSVDTLSCACDDDCQSLSDVDSEFLSDPTFFPGELGRVSLEIISLLSREPGLNITEVAKEISSSPRTVSRKKTRLKEAGIVEVNGGREKNMHLAKDFKHRLANYVPKDPSNYGLNVERKIENIHQRKEFEKHKTNPNYQRIEKLKKKEDELLDSMGKVQRKRQNIRERRSKS